MPTVPASGVPAGQVPPARKYGVPGSGLLAALHWVAIVWNRRGS
jgi:hypothetical protein